MKRLFILIVLLFSGLEVLAIVPKENTSGPDLIYRELSWQDRTRDYLLYLPPVDFMLGSLPVVINLHGGGGTAKGTYRLTKGRFNQLAKEEGFIVVYPNAVNKSWNDGRSQILKPENKDVDDVGFITQIIKELKTVYNIDLSRVFVTGMSNGGFMSSRLLCDRADLFRAGAIITASISQEYFPKCKPTQPVGVLVMNGTDDPLVPYDGGQIKVFRKTRGSVLSTNAYIDFWRKQNNCNKQATREALPNLDPKDGSTVEKTSYDCGANPVELYKIKGGGHTWPGGRQYLGKRLIGDYQSRHKRL